MSRAFAIMDMLLLPLMVCAACGLALSLMVHVLSLFGVVLGGNTLFTALHLGIFRFGFRSC